MVLEFLFRNFLFRTCVRRSVSAGSPTLQTTASGVVRVVDAPPPIDIVPVLDVAPGKARGMTLLTPDHDELVRLDREIDRTFLARLLSTRSPDDLSARALDGGYALLANDEVLFAPSYDCTLDELERWREALEPWEFGWREIWTGRSSVIALRQGDAVFLQGSVEPGAPGLLLPDPAEAVFRVAASELDAAIDRAEALCRKLVPLFAEALPGRSLRQAAILLGLDPLAEPDL